MVSPQIEANQNLTYAKTVLAGLSCVRPAPRVSFATTTGRLPTGAGGPGIPPVTLTWTAAVSDYIVSTGVRGTFANIAYAGNPGGNRHGALQPVAEPGFPTNIGRAKIRHFEGWNYPYHPDR